MNYQKYNDNVIKFSLISGFLFLLFSGSTNAQTLNEAQGTGSGVSITTGDYNTMYGDSSGHSNRSGSQNVMIGYRAGLHLERDDNVIIGANALGGTPTNNRSTDNVIIGARAGFHHYGFDAVIIGTEAGYNNNNGGNVVFIGQQSGYSNTSGDDNIFIGKYAGYNNTTASDNTFVGSRAGYYNTTGEGNTFMGAASTIDLENHMSNNYGVRFSLGQVSAGYHNTTGMGNTAIGAGAGSENGTGDANTFLGYSAGGKSEYADLSTFIGFAAGWGNNRFSSTTNANRNTYLGAYTGGTNEQGEDNVGMGALADFGGQNNRRNRTVFIGAKAKSNNNDVTVLGYNALVSGEFGIGIGNESDVLSTGAIGIGYLSQIKTGSDYSIGIGYSVDIDNVGGIGIGSNATVQGDNSIIIGRGSSSTGTNSVGIGQSISLTANNEVFLGNALTESVGGSVNWTATSDARFKKNVNENIPGLSFVNKLRPVSYNFDTKKMSEILQNESATNSAKDKLVYTGFIAQEVEKAAADLGFDFSGIKVPENQHQAYGLRYAEFVVPLVQAVKELSAKNLAQEKLISANTETIAAYENRLLAMEKKMGLLLQSKNMAKN